MKPIRVAARVWPALPGLVAALAGCGPVVDPVPPACIPACQPDELCRNHVCVRKDQTTPCDGGSCDNPQPCAVTCDGCCEGETCHPGDTNALCGSAGGACQVCGENLECSAERLCVTVLPQVGEGCTDECGAGLLCVPEKPGESYCRTDCAGAACATGYTCLAAAAWGGVPAGSACVPAPASTSRWSVHVRSLAIESRQWDYTSKPDALVCVKLIDGDEECTAYQDDKTSYVWDSPIQVEGSSAVWSVPAAKLEGAEITVYDYDPYDPNDKIHTFSGQNLKPPWKGHPLDLALSDSGDGVQSLQLRVSPL